MNKIISTSYPSIKPLVSYLDGEALLNPKTLSKKAPKHMISKDIEKFESELIKINSMMENIEKSCNDKNILEMLDSNAHLENFKKIFPDL